MKSSVFWERLVLVASVVGLMTSGAYLIFSSPKIKTVNVKNGSIGFVHPVGPDVRIRGLEESEWNTIRSDANVFQDDKVYTGQSSSAIVNLKSQQKLTVRPNSLIVIADKTDTVSVDMDAGGGFLSEIKKGVKLFVKKDKTETQIESTGAVIQLEAQNKNEIKLVVLKGEATVKSDGQEKPVQVVAHEEVKVVEQKVDITPLNIELMTPSPGDVLWNEKQGLQFSWNIKEDDKNAVFVVEVSRDPLFPENETLRKESSEHSLELSVAPGRVYFWRVKNKKSVSHSESYSATSSFSFFDLQPPVIIGNAELQIKTDWRGQVEKPITFGWVDPSMSDRYLFQMSMDKDFSKVTYEETSKSNSLSISNISEGVVYWRVISSKDGRKDLTSNVGQLIVTAEKPPVEAPIEMPLASNPKVQEQASQIPPTVEPEPIPSPVPQVAAPEPVLPPLTAPLLKKDKYVFDLNDIKSFAEISWEPIASASEYRVELATDREFKGIIQSDSTSSAKWTWTDSQAGSYYIRVAAERTDKLGHKEEAVSEYSILKVNLPAPLLTDFDLINDEFPQQAMLTWDGASDAESYEIQISEDANFKDVKKAYSKTRQLLFEVTGPKEYFARVRSYIKNKGVSSPLSNVLKISVPGLPVPVQAEVKVEEKPQPVAVIEPAPEPPKINPPSQRYLYDPKFSVYAGTGFDYLSFDQKGNTGSESGGFSTINYPTTLLGLNVKLASNTRLRFEYHLWPGKMKADETAPLTSTDFNWSTMIGEAQVRLHETEHSSYDLLLGAQRHSVPFLSVSSNDTTLDILQNNLLNASVGFQARYLSESKKYEYEIFGRYQHMLSSASENGFQFEAHPKLMFDGSVGVARYFDNGLKAGVYWFGQQQSFQYDFTRDGTSTSGEQSFFNSNVQFRIEWGFYGFLCVASGPLFVRFRRRRKAKEKIS